MSSIGQHIKIYIVVLILFLAIDLPVTLFAFKKHDEQFKLINAETPPTTTAYWLNTSLKYLILSIGLYYFSVSGKSYLASIMFGLCIYGFYNTVTLSTISKYNAEDAAINVAYGTGLCFGIMLVSTVIGKIFGGNDSALTETSTDLE